MSFNENDLESVILEKLNNKGYEYGNDTDSWFSERKLNEFVNTDLLISQLKVLNNHVKESLLESAVNEILNIDVPSLFERNRIFHEYLTRGITIETGNNESNPTIRLIDFENVNNNIFEVVNQVRFNEKGQTRIPDVIVYTNGLPLVVFELKSPEYRTDTFLIDAYNQLGGKGDNDGYRYTHPIQL